MTTTGKTCFKCGEFKPHADFYRHKAMRDGHLNKCKDCTRADVRQHRRSPEYREKVLAYDRKRGNRQPPEYHKAYDLRNPTAYKARTALRNAVRDGKVMKLSRCQLCGSASQLHGHHHDYSKPLAVVWLCAACHRQHHAMMDLVSAAFSLEVD